MSSFDKKVAASLVLALVAGLAAERATAAVVINVNEAGGDVVFSTIGSLDLGGATFLNGISYADGFIPGGSNW
jgi:hypothetical protein